MARRVVYVLLLGVLLQMPAFTQTASVLQPGTSPLIVTERARTKREA